MTLSRGAPEGAAGAVAAGALVEVLRSVLAYVGLKGKASERLLAEAMKAHGAAPDGECTLVLTAHAGELEIALSQSGRSWRTTCPAGKR